MKVSIVGITGYSGLELVKILNNHKKVELVSITQPRKWADDCLMCIPI